MARIKYSSLVAKISGSVAGITFQDSKSGPILRSKPIPIHSKSESQLNIRSQIQTIHNAWFALSSGDRAKWNYFLSWSKQTQKHNPNLLINGYQLYCKYQSARLTAGLGLLSSFDFTPLESYPNSFELYNSGATFYAFFPDYVQSVKYFFNLFLTYPVSVGSAYRNNGLRFMPVSYGDGPLYYLINSYPAAFGVLPLPSQQVNFRIYWFGTTSPTLGYYQTGSKIIKYI